MPLVQMRRLSSISAAATQAMANQHAAMSGRNGTKCAVASMAAPPAPAVAIKVGEAIRRTLRISINMPNKTSSLTKEFRSKLTLIL